MYLEYYFILITKSVDKFYLKLINYYLFPPFNQINNAKEEIKLFIKRWVKLNTHNSNFNYCHNSAVIPLQFSIEYFNFTFS